MPASSPTERISSLSSQLDSKSSSKPSQEHPPTSSTMATPSRPPITCHVLDTTIGRPGANIPVKLTLLQVGGRAATANLPFTAITNSDGRVTSWTAPNPAHLELHTLCEKDFSDEDFMWSLTFNTEEYFGKKGIKTFFPEVEVKFVVRREQRGEHFHVPVLLGPFGYTTYRGS
ncbi:Hydroxyisourate hydrolase [Delitschia confertaspora ATCC 74209]|uniref:hydroxyisourate hydrolase n=1 Tax=Delitschia confertaspora ATCC 74209 TaxID=1513339 RepID=A0A9P4JFA1_9PLEO|nr:Hydroxyisourate hydrolase [Delitschia confertaspora ATCC 74209]